MENWDHVSFYDVWLKSYGNNRFLTVGHDKIQDGHQTNPTKDYIHLFNIVICLLGTFINLKKLGIAILSKGGTPPTKWWSYIYRKAYLYHGGHIDDVIKPRWRACATDNNHFLEVHYLYYQLMMASCFLQEMPTGAKFLPLGTPLYPSMSCVSLLNATICGTHLMECVSLSNNFVSIH